MIRLALKLALASAAVWAVWSFVPLRGKTLAQRWDASPSVPAFVARGWSELERGWAELAGGDPRPQARKPGPAARARPTEAHTEADRREVDRLVAEGLAERR